MLAWCLHSPFWFMGFRFPLHSQTPVTSPFMKCLSKQVCARLPVFPFFSDDSDSVDSNDSGSIGIDSNDTVLLLIPVSSDDSLSATSSENSSWVLHASQDQTHPGLDWDGVSSLQVFDLST